MTCELCGRPEGVVELSTGLQVHPRCFWSGRLSSSFVNRRFSSGTTGGWEGKG